MERKKSWRVDETVDDRSWETIQIAELLDRAFVARPFRVPDQRVVEFAKALNGVKSDKDFYPAVKLDKSQVRDIRMNNTPAKRALKRYKILKKRKTMIGDGRLERPAPKKVLAPMIPKRGASGSGPLQPRRRKTLKRVVNQGRHDG